MKNHIPNFNEFLQESTHESVPNPIEFIIKPGEFISSPGIRATRASSGRGGSYLEYSEPAEEYFKFPVFILMDDGSVLSNGFLYDSIEDAEARKKPNHRRLFGVMEEPVRKMYKSYETALDRAESKGVVVYVDSLSKGSIFLRDEEGILNGKVSDAKKYVSSKVVPSLKKEFSGIKVTVE